MKTGDRKIFFAELGALGEVMNESLSEVKAKIYFEDLSDYPIEVVVQALRTARKEFRWFPRIKDLRELCHEIFSSMPKKRIPEDHQLPERIELSEEERKASEARVKAIIEDCKRKLGIGERKTEEMRREELRRQAEVVN